MDPAANQRIAPGRVLLIMVLLLAVWAGFQFWPRKKPVPSLPPVAAVPETKLHAVGLADNPDWEGLPDYFAIVANQAEWENGKTHFAYWHPVMKTYSYYFEATRVGAGFRFKEIAKPQDGPEYASEGMDETGPVRLLLSATRSGPLLPQRMSVDSAGKDDGLKVKVDIPASNISPPEVKVVPIQPATKP